MLWEVSLLTKLLASCVVNFKGSKLLQGKQNPLIKEKFFLFFIPQIRISFTNSTLHRQDAFPTLKSTINKIY